MSVIYIGSDHAGFKLKERLKDYLEGKGYEVRDVGANIYDKKDDYPDYALKLARAVAKNKSMGIGVCGSAHGMCIVANRVKGIRASIAWNKTSARYAKSHTEVNMLCIPARLIKEKDAVRIINVWLKTKASKNKRHVRRRNKIAKIK